MTTNYPPEVTTQLANLRRELEGGVGDIRQIRVPVVELLSDVCNALGLTPMQRLEVLGQRGVRYIDQLNAETITPNPKPARR